MRTNKLLLLALSILFLCQATKEVIAMPTLNKKYTAALNRIQSVMPNNNTDRAILIDISTQTLRLYAANKEISAYPISSSKFGIGSKKNSNKTPLGVHRVQNKIGKNAPLGTIFRARANTGKKAEIITEPIDIKTDLVTTRIIWLKGMEEGLNSGEGVDSYKRYIYIHGTPEEGLIGTPASHGCIRMKNNDVIELFDKIEKKTPVVILD